MTEHKSYSFRPPLYHSENNNDSTSKSSGNAGSTERSRASAESQGWEAYRRWLSRVGAHPTRERSPVDNSLYSWKGYNSWADRIKRTWKPEETDS